METREPGGRMGMFMVDRSLPGMTWAVVAELQRLLQEAARRVRSGGSAVRYVRCIYLPEDDRCICLFEADDPATVRTVNEIAQVPFHRISRAIEFWAVRGPRRRPGDRRSHDDA